MNTLKTNSTGKYDCSRDTGRALEYVRVQVFDRVRNQVWKPLKGQVDLQVRIQVANQIRDQTGRLYVAQSVGYVKDQALHIFEYEHA